MTILVTHPGGVNGANFVLDWLALSDEPVINFDALNYACNPKNLTSLDPGVRRVLVKSDTGDFGLVARLLAEHQLRALPNFVIESHADRSINCRAGSVLAIDCYSPENKRRILQNDNNFQQDWPLFESSLMSVKCVIVSGVFPFLPRRIKGCRK